MDTFLCGPGEREAYTQAITTGWVQIIHTCIVSLFILLFVETQNIW